MYKALQLRTTFGSCDVEKVHAIVARSTFASEKAKDTSPLEHFRKLRCRKKCTQLWREAHFEVKLIKALHYMFGALLDVQMSFRVAGARDCAPCQK